MKIEHLWRVTVNTPWFGHISVHDAETGEKIPGVVEADARRNRVVVCTAPAEVSGVWTQTEVERKIYLELDDDAPAAAVEWFSIPDPGGDGR